MENGVKATLDSESEETFLRSDIWVENGWAGRSQLFEGLGCKSPSKERWNQDPWMESAWGLAKRKARLLGTQ